MDEFFGTFFGSTVVSQQLAYLEASLLKDIWETFYSTVLSTFFAYVIGLPLGIILVTGEPDGVRPLPRALMRVINVIVNLLRSVPFLILMVLVIPLSRVVIGTSVGTVASIIPLVARLVEASLRESDHGILEAAQAMGCTPMQITFKVMLPEALPSLINGFTTAFITILGYGAMSAAIGGGGLGSLAINNGYQRRMYLVLYVSVILLVIMVQIFQSLGTHTANRLDRRNTKARKRGKRGAGQAKANDET